MNNVSVRVMNPEEILEKTEEILKLSVKLAKSLSENGVVVSVFEDNFGEGQVCNVCVDFSEHDKKVAEEKDAEIRELKRQIEDLEEIIAEGKKPDIASISKNGASMGCECGGYHLAKERIKVLEKENSELDRMRKSWMETAQKWSEINSELQDKIANLECSSKTMSELENRHQSDCIRINQLLTTIDVLTERYQKF